MRYSYFAVLLMLCWIIGAPVHAQTPASRDWSGFYAGGSVGGAKGVADTETTTTIGGTNSYFSPPDDVQIIRAGDGSLSQQRLSGGIFGGFGKQYGAVLVGIEASANSLYIEDSRSQTVTYISQPAAQFTLKQTVKADWQGTLRLRLGYAHANWLAYVTGGAAMTRVKLETTFSDNWLGSASAQGSNSESKVGWTLGAGGEYILSESWNIRVDYLYADFGKLDGQSVVTNPSFPNVSNTLTNSTNVKTQTITIGLVYRFP